MKPLLYAHPFSSYSQKIQIALYEGGVDFTYRMLGPDDPAPMRELAALWPLGKFPVLVDDDGTFIESTIIIEHLALAYPGVRGLLASDAASALETRFMDRFFDNYVMTPMQRIVANALRPETDRDPYGVEQSRRALDQAYGWLQDRLEGRQWAEGGAFSLADCAAAPSLFYADWAHPIGEQFTNVRAYRARLLARPSVARAVEEARPYRPLFPLGAPDRD